MLNNKGRLRQDQPVQRHCHLDGRAGAAHPRHRRRRSAQPVQQLRHAPQREKNFGAAVLAEQDLNGYIQPTHYENIDIIVGRCFHGYAGHGAFTKISRENIVRSILRPVIERGYYDYILIDTNPNLSLLNFNIVNASHYVLIPAQPASFDLDGLAVVLQFVEGYQNPITRLCRWAASSSTATMPATA